MPGPNNLDEFLKNFDAKRPAAPSDATRVDQPEAIISNGEISYPQPNQDPWVGGTVTDFLHRYEVKDKNPEIAAKQKEALKNAIDFFSPQSLGGLALVAGGPLASSVRRGANRGAKIVKELRRRNAIEPLPARSPEQYYVKYKVDNTIKAAKTKLPAISQKTGTNIFEDSQYNIIENVNRVHPNFPESIHRIQIRPKGSYNKSDNLAHMKFRVTDLNKLKARRGDIRGERFNDMDLAIKMVEGKGLKNPKYISGVHFYTDIGNPKDSARALKMVFDRFDDDWILNENTLTMDSFTIMVSSILRNYAKEIEFLKGRGRNIYGSSQYSQLTKASQKALQRPIANIQVDANSKTLYKDILGKLSSGMERSGKLVGNPKLGEEGLSVISRPFIMKSFKDKLAGIFGLSAVEMSDFLEQITEENMTMDKKE
jgi:hypothetical protein